MFEYVVEPALQPNNPTLQRIFRPAPKRLTARALAALALVLLGLSLVQADWRVSAVCLLAAVAASLLGVKTMRLDDVATSGFAGKRQAAMWENAINTLIAHDLDPAFLTDADGEIRLSNPAAQARFGDLFEEPLATAFDVTLANPEAVLFRLQSKANVYGAAKEDIVTRRGHFRLSVVQINDSNFLWRIDESGENRQTARAADTLALPMMTIGNRDTVLYANDAMKRLLGSRPRRLTGVIDPLPIQSGQVHLVETAKGPVRMLISVIRSSAGRSEVFALPAPRQHAFAGGDCAGQGGWDAIEDLPVPLLKISPDGQIMASNRESRNLLGRETLNGSKLGDLIDGLGRPVEEWLREVLAGHGGHVSQFLRGRGDRQSTFLQVTLNAAECEDGAHLIAVLNDVTELKTLEAQFVQSQKMQAIGQLAGGVAHDFNNLLTAISGHCDLLLLRHDPGDQNYGDLVQINQNANRAASLVGQLLAFSRKQNLQPQQLDLREAISDMTYLLNRLVGERVHLSVDHDPDLAPIKADKRQLEQVMMNLVVNARDAMPDGGEIRVTTENFGLEEPMRRDRAVVPAGTYVAVHVSDEGTGIAPDKIGSIFEPFVTTKRVGEGTGLGLSTVYGIIKQSGAFVFVESEVGRGSKFTLLFPSHDLAVADPPPAPSEQTHPVPHQGDGVVLLVEDEAPVRSFAVRALQMRGYTVLEADCAETALELLEDPDLGVDIFVTDVIMPGKDGPTWVREALVQRPDTKVIFVSGYAEDAFTDGKATIPNSVFLPKPFSLSELVETVQRQLH